MSAALVDRARGCLLGLVCGDAVGTAVEFKPRGAFPPVTDMLGGGADPRSAINGAIMRLAPVPIWCHASLERSALLGREQPHRARRARVAMGARIVAWADALLALGR